MNDDLSKQQLNLIYDCHYYEYQSVLTMKSLASLTRAKSSIETSYRRTYGNVNMVNRKDLRRLKKINIYNKQISGQSNPNPWFVPKRLKALGNHIQSMKNNHIGSNPVSPEIQKQLLKVMVPLSQFQYFSYRNRHMQIQQFNNLVQKCDVQHYINQMPTKLRKQIQSSEEKPMPQIGETLLKYTQQIQIYLPMDERHRYNLMQKIQHPPKAKLQSEEL